MEYLAAIVASSDDAIISKSLDGTITSWNRGGEKMFGYSAKQAMGKHISLIIPPEYFNEEKNILDRIRNNETIDHFETVRIKKSGEQFYVSLTVSPLKDRTGMIIGISTIARDITARKKSETEFVLINKELAFQNEEKENRAAELIIANKELAFQNEEKENRAAELIIANKELAFQNEEKENRAAELIIANKELAFQNEEKEIRAAELIIANKELAFQNNKKEMRAAELVIANKELAFQNEEKEKRAAELIMANNDLKISKEQIIEVNKELESFFYQLKKSEKRYSDLFYLSPQPMWVFDTETLGFVQVNKAATDLYGYSQEEFMNMTLLDINREEDILQVKEDIMAELADDSIFKKTICHRKKSGEIIEVEIYSTPIIINNKNLRSVIAIDVTEKNQFENKITRAIIKTQEDERHEIGAELHDNVCQLLVVSKLNFGMVKESIKSSKIVLFSQGIEYISMALEEIRNLSHRLAPAFFDESTLEEAFEKLFITFDVEKKFKILLRFDDAVKKYPLPVELQLNLYRILQEQLRNIQKYARADLIEVDLLIFNNKLKMTISDDGIGFNVNTVKEGIGLANMKRRAELFSGKFSIDSSRGKGCTVVIDIPLRENK